MQARCISSLASFLLLPSRRLRRVSRLLASLVHVRRCPHSLSWLFAFFSSRQGGLTRKFWLSLPPVASNLRVAVDASPWGLGVVFLSDGVPSRWFADKISNGYLCRFGASVGDPAFNILWEALAILVALRLWRKPNHQGASIEIRSDSLRFPLSFIKGSSKNPHIQITLRELALDEAYMIRPINILTHIPGVSNILPDHLSRVYAPTPHAIPNSLSSVSRDFPPRRNRNVYKSLQPFAAPTSASRPPRHSA